MVVDGDANSDFNLLVVSLGSKVSEERTQKITLKLTPLQSKEEVIRDEELNAVLREERGEKIVQTSKSNSEATTYNSGGMFTSLSRRVGRFRGRYLGGGGIIAQQYGPPDPDSGLGSG